MKKVRLLSLASASLFAAFTASAQFADSVVGYNAGAGGSPGYADPTRALGAPTTFIGYQNTDPFNPPYSGGQLVSMGSGGSLTLQFNAPILNTAHNWGLDFIIFGNAGFVITNGDYSGGGITDGSLFSQNPGSTHVWVSPDNLTYYRLDPNLARTVDTLFPTDAAGDWHLPVDPSLNHASFAGLGLGGIRGLYNGSGGGAGYDLAWAQDAYGQNVWLSSISYIRIDVLAGKSEVDAIAMVPEPTSWALCGLGALILSWKRRQQV